LNQDYTPFSGESPEHHFLTLDIVHKEMNRISSRWTRFIKWATPAAWLCALGYFLISGAFNDATGIAVILLVAICGLVAMKLFLWNLADEVYDCGDSLLVRRGGVEESVPLADVTQVALALFSRPPRITLKLAKPGRFGRSIVFTPPTSPGLEIFGRNPIAEDLLARVQRAR
jgi:hypothetical protein